jgi:hypothetical protein
MNTGLWNMGSGLAAARRPGMTRGRNHHWDIEHSTFKDEYGFVSYRLIEKQPEQPALI